MKPLVSVVVTTYNQAPYIARAIESVFAQTWRDLEVIVVDDGSTDETPQRVGAYRDRLTYVHQQNQGVAEARNAGLRRARGDLMAFLDGDDLWEPDKLATQADAARRHPRSGLIVVDGVQFGERGVLETSLLGRSVKPLLARAKGPVVSGNCYRELIAANFVCTTSQVMIPRQVLARVGPSNPRFALASDYDLYLRIAAEYDVTVVRYQLARWRYVETSASGPRELRFLRWWRDEIAVLKAHRAVAPAAHRSLIGRAIRRRIRDAAQMAYYRGREGHRRWAGRYLRELLAENPRHPTILVYLVGLGVPSRCASLVGPTVRRLLRTRALGQERVG